MDSFTVFGYSFSILDVFILFVAVGYGFYALYTAIRLQKERKFFTNKLLLPGNDLKETDCIDPEGYFMFIIPRLWIFGFCLVIFGAMDVFMPAWVQAKDMPMWLSFLGIIPLMIVLFWFAAGQHKAARIYFE